MNQFDGVLRTQLHLRDMTRFAVSQIPVERFLDRADNPFSDHRQRHVRAANLSASGRLEQVLHRQRQPGSLDLLDHQAVSIGAVILQVGETIQEWHRVVVNEVAQEMKLPGLVIDAELDARNEADIRRARRRLTLGEAADRIVIGDAEGGETGLQRQLNELSGSERAVGGGGVSVKINHFDRIVSTLGR